MSIISDALKKAQSKRSDKDELVDAADPASSDKSPDQLLDEMVKSQKPGKTGTGNAGRMISIVGILFMVLLLGGTTFFLMASRRSSPTSVKHTDVSQKKATPDKPARGLAKKDQERSAVKVSPVIKRTGEILRAGESRRKESALQPQNSKAGAAQEEEPTSSLHYYEPEKLPALSGIMYSPTNPLAILDGEMVSEGEAFGEFKVQKILPDRVKLTYSGKEYELRLR